MNRNSIISAYLAFLCLFAVLSTQVDAHAEGYQPYQSLKWPLWNKSHTDAERTRIWTYLGEPQDREPGKALHSGNDFRGIKGDVVKAVAAGNVWFTHKLSECRNSAGYDCRIYILGKPTTSNGDEVELESDADHRYVYYYSHLWLGDSTDLQNTPDDAIVTSETREKLESASSGGKTSYPVNNNTEIAAGEAIALIGKFPNWRHLHFGIYDKLDNYNAIAPLTALEKNNNPDTYDAEDPLVHSVYLMTDNQVLLEPSSTNSEQPEGDCGTITRQHYHILAAADDRFERVEDLAVGQSGDEWWVDNQVGERLSVHEASYIIRRVGADDEGEENTWFNFDKMPFECTGDPNAVGYSCANFADRDFWDYSIDASDDGGAVLPGLTYASIIYHGESDMAQGKVEHDNFINLTNEWGEEGYWDATDETKYPHGQYQITVRVFDQARREGQLTSWVYLGDDSTDCTCSDLPPAIYLRDNQDDDGAIPSETPHWISRDIVILEPGEGPPTSENTRGISSNDIQMNTPYEIWVRVHRLNCASTDTIQAKVIELKPSPILDPNDPASESVDITQGYKSGDIDFGFGDKNDPNFGHIGPFDWTPTHSGHRCLIARVKFESESNPSEEELVQDDRRYTQRNLQEIDGQTPSQFWIINPHQSSAEIGIEFDARSLPIGQPGAAVTLTMEHNTELYNAWSNVPGTAIATNAAGEIELSFYGSKIWLPTATLPGNIHLEGSVELSAADGTCDRSEVYFAEWVDGTLRGGMSFGVKNSCVP